MFPVEDAAFHRPEPWLGHVWVSAVRVGEAVPGGPGLRVWEGRTEPRSPLPAPWAPAASCLDSDPPTTFPLPGRTF